LLAAVKERDVFLRLTYVLGSVPLLLTVPIINKLGLKSLYVIKVLIIFAVIMCLIKYLINAIALYNKTFKQKEEADNKDTAPHGLP